MTPVTMYWKDETLWILDQRRLPMEIEYLKCDSLEVVARAIENLSVRGAPAIGIAAAFGVALAARGGRKKVIAGAERLASTRPTAINLFWALERMKSAAATTPEADLYERLLVEADRMLQEDISANRKLGSYGQSLLPDNPVIITHCNAGSLATGGYGTALGVIRAAFESGKNPSVYACETRPVLQGARLTALELSMDGIDVTVITDGMAGALMKKKRVTAVITGADRIASNGDSANKIGTYSLAVLAEYHRIPFYIAAPISTFDFALSSGDGMVIEERNPSEVRSFGSEKVLHENIRVWNPAFDITPADLIDCIITETGLIYPPYIENISRISDKR